jgi:hypothetical protein
MKTRIRDNLLEIALSIDKADGPYSIDTLAVRLEQHIKLVGGRLTEQARVECYNAAAEAVLTRIENEDIAVEPASVD